MSAPVASRRRLLAAALAAAAVAWGAPAFALTRAEALGDFDEMWTAIDRGYAYFDRGHGEWRRARDAWRPRAAKARDRAELAAVLHGAIGHLHDDHVSLSREGPGAPRRVPAETDIWASWRGRAAVVEAVRAFGDADVGGLHPGDVVLRIDGEPVELTVRHWLAAHGGAAGDRDHALRHVLSGAREGTARLDVRDGSGRRTVEVVRRANAAAPAPPVSTHRMGEARDVGYLRLRSGATAAHVDAAMDTLHGTRALIVDLRDANDAAAREATLALLGRLARTESTWRLRVPAAGGRIADRVAPRGAAPYPGPVVALVDRWTAGEGEALAAGLKAVAGARLVGTAMAGLRGELREVRLPHSRASVRFPAEKVLHVDGTPREKLLPDVAVDLAAPQGGPGDPILYQALKLLER